MGGVQGSIGRFWPLWVLVGETEGHRFWVTLPKLIPARRGCGRPSEFSPLFLIPEVRTCWRRESLGRGDLVGRAGGSGVPALSPSS